MTPRRDEVAITYAGKKARIAILKTRLDFAQKQWDRAKGALVSSQREHLKYKMPKLADQLRVLKEFVPSVPGEYGYGKELKSGAFCNCGHCGYEGYCYGTPVIGGRHSGISVPWCRQCGINNQLRIVQQ